MKCVILLALFPLISCSSEQGVWKDIKMNKDNSYYLFRKIMYNNTRISVQIHCASEDKEIKVGWLLRFSPCAGEYSTPDANAQDVYSDYFTYPEHQWIPEYKQISYIKSFNQKNTILCSDHIILQDETNATITVIEAETEFQNASAASDTESKQKKKEERQAESRRKRAGDDSGGKTGSEENSKDDKSKTVGNDSGNSKDNTESEKTTHTVMKGSLASDKPTAKTQIDLPDVVKTWTDGNFGFFLHVEGVDIMDDFEVRVTVRMHGKYGYISAHEWPLLIFYGVMGLVYLFLGIIWLVMLACNWRDLLRVQFWIGGVIVLGMIEKAVFYAEYQSVANNGYSVTSGAIIFAEVVSSLKRALARMLVMIVSVGFGIVKPRLGPTLHKVLFLGGLYFILGSIEGSMRALQPIPNRSTESMLAAVPLVVLDASIIWWIFSSLIVTTRQLRLRRNIVKLSLYRHFTNTLIFAVLASVVFMIWSLIQVKTKKCLSDWQELWVDEAFWHLLFSVILIVIMILWRPSSNNQRYAFSPLLDAEEDEEEEDPVMNDAFDGMKMRSKAQANGSPKAKERNSIEDDLKWVEDNIPSSVADKALPSLLDSDEEIMTTKYEMSKMQ